jgi:FdhD protein
MRSKLPPAQITQGQLYGLVNAIRLQETTYKSSGSVHGCALFQGEDMLMFVEDVGRHNAVDTIAGWMWMNDTDGKDKVFYTTGRLTSEMVIKSAQMGVPVVVSRSGITQMGLDVANRLGLCAIGRATQQTLFVLQCPRTLGLATRIGPLSQARLSKRPFVRWGLLPRTSVALCLCAASPVNECLNATNA